MKIPFSYMSGLDSDALNWFAQLSTKPSTDFQRDISIMIQQLKSAGIWTLLDRFWIHATEIQQHATISIVNPTSTVITEVSSPTWTRLSGYTTNGTTSYLNTNFTPSSNGVNYTRFNASFGVGFRNNIYTQTSPIHMAANDGINYSFIQPDISGTDYFTINSPSGQYGTDTTPGGGVNGNYFVTTIDNLPTIYDFTKNNTLIGSFSAPVIGQKPSTVFEIGRMDGNSVWYANARYLFSMIGSGNINMSTFNNIISDFFTRQGII